MASSRGEAPPTRGPRQRRARRMRRERPRLAPSFRDRQPPGNAWAAGREVRELPYRFARFSVKSGGFLDLTVDGDDDLLRRRGLPVFRTPEELAAWLGLPLGKVAWLIHRFTDDSRPPTRQAAHYHFRWERKRAGGWRLIESPKSTLKAVQRRILREILDRVPAHSAAHGFVPGRSILTNAAPHVGQEVVVRYDLTNFYPTVRFSRVAAIFRGFGYCREAAVWLARLCTSALPQTIEFPEGEANAIRPYLPAHLPQGAPTSPALANLSAYRLDLRLQALVAKFGGVYTRYADDMTFSGPPGFRRALPTFLPLAEQVIHQERFRINRAKRRVLRTNVRQIVAGVVTNSRINAVRADYDRLKAILTNCLRHGPASQNRAGVPNFEAHLHGRIAHFRQLNPERGAKLQAIFLKIVWPPPCDSAEVH